MVEEESFPKSLGIIPDGNRRYARKEGLTHRKAYEKGFEKVEEVYKWVLDQDYIEEVFFYALSTENLKRDEREIEIIFDLFNRKAYDLYESEIMKEYDVSIEFLGREELLEPISETIKEIEENTKERDSYKLNICIGYGGKKEIVDAARDLKLKNLEFNEKNLEENLYTSSSIDLVIRTGGYQRLSNFLIWQSSYAELFFTDQLWPEFSEQEFEKAIEFYRSSERNFGK